ncbi:MAG: TetR/AcrR family transcriptional regulator [Actinomycetia bacterium]|nr:TetR/AcrR family transcriptional regulator [Actinomycetes bacterium]
MTIRPHTKVTRDDWIASALTQLRHEPIDQLKVLTIANTLDVSRSSFYWYFEQPSDLQGELLDLWRRNTDSIVERSKRPTSTPVAACLAVFECWVDPLVFDAVLDLAVRDWGRRDEAIAAEVAAADTKRVEAITDMFCRHGFEPSEALVRARLLYHSQVGYYAVGTDEPNETRMSYLPYYLEAMAGTPPTEDEIAEFEAFNQTLGSAAT